MITRQKALALHLVRGGKVSIKTAYNYFGISNISREIRRLIENPFGVELNREQKQGKTVHRVTGLSIQQQRKRKLF